MLLMTPQQLLMQIMSMDTHTQMCRQCICLVPRLFVSINLPQPTPSLPPY